MTRLLVPVLLVGAAVVVSLVLLRDDGLTLHVRFAHARQLVPGGSAKVAGHKVGTISRIGLTPDGQADVELEITDGDVLPLRAGTRAAIRAVGQAGITNRFVDLAPGPPGGAELADGAVLPVSQTAEIVNLDALLDSFTPARRAAFRELVAGSVQIYAGSGAPHVNGMLAELDPALAELQAVGAELASDRAALGRLVRTASRTATAIASRRTDLTAAVDGTAQALAAVASRRDALADVLVRAPAVLRQARGTLAATSDAVETLRPALREVPAAGAPLAGLLRQVTQTLPAARPVIGQLRAQLPPLRASLAGLRPLWRPGVRALRSTARAFRDSRHILRAIRFYGSDLLLGLFNGLAGVATANHGRWGHYARLEFVQPLQTLLGGSLAGLLDKQPLVPGLFDLRTGLLRRCPGGNTPPAPDGSSPWIPDPALCTPEHNTPATVNDPPRLGG